MKYLALALAGTAMIAWPTLAQTTAAPATTAPSGAATAGAATATSTAATTAARPTVTVGAKVSDTTGAQVGTVESATADNAVVNTGTAKASIPLTSFAQGTGGLVIGMTKADLESAVAKAATPTEIAVGAQVNDSKGGKVGTVSAVAGNLVTVSTANAKAQLPKSAFAKDAQGLVIAMTASELEAAAKAAAPKNGG